MNKVSHTSVLVAVQIQILLVEGGEEDDNILSEQNEEVPPCALGAVVVSANPRSPQPALCAAPCAHCALCDGRWTGRR